MKILHLSSELGNWLDQSGFRAAYSGPGDAFRPCFEPLQLKAPPVAVLWLKSLLGLEAYATHIGMSSLAALGHTMLKFTVISVIFMISVTFCFQDLYILGQSSAVTRLSGSLQFWFRNWVQIFRFLVSRCSSTLASSVELIVQLFIDM